MGFNRLSRAMVAAAVLGVASLAQAGIAFQSYTPGQSPGDYSASTLNLDRVIISGEGGSFPATTGGWFTFSMPHAGAFSGITIPLLFTTASANTTVNFGFWLGNDPATSTVGGVNLPVADVVVGQTKEYSFDFSPGFTYSSGQRVTIKIDVVGGTGSATIDAFMSNTPGTTHETSLGVIFDPTPLSFYPAIQIRDNSIPAPEPAGAAILLAGGMLAMIRRTRSDPTN